MNYERIKTKNVAKLALGNNHASDFNSLKLIWNDNSSEK